MNTIELLKAARTKLTEPNAWTKDVAFALDAEGALTDPTSPLATSYCAVGVLYSIMGVTHPTTCHAVRVLDIQLPNPESRIPDETGVAVMQYNDLISTGHEDILALYDRSIASLERYASVHDQ